MRPRKVQLADSNKVLEGKVKQLLGGPMNAVGEGPWAARMDPKSL